ncbi:MAG: amidoligase family protein, partial [archaeon]|nr:amidoligase family protein [archaeon]
ESRAGHLLFSTNAISSLVSFSYWLQNEIQREQHRYQNTPRKLLNHSAKATDTFKFKFEPKTKLTKTPLFLGIELELEGHSDKEYITLDTLKDHAIFKTDGSLTQGVEICTAPATIDIHKKEFCHFFNKLKENKSKLKSSPNCGLHIHIDKKTISQLHLANLYLLINNKKNETELIKIAGREANRFCEKHETTYEYFTNYSDRDSVKYRQVNLSPENTIELRLFASTTNFLEFSKRLEFAQALVDYTRPGELPIPTHQIPLWKNFTTYVTKQAKFYPELAKVFGYQPKPKYMNPNVHTI